MRLGTRKAKLGMRRGEGEWKKKVGVPEWEGLVWIPGYQRAVNGGRVETVCERGQRPRGGWGVEGQRGGGEGVLGGG